MGARVSRFSQLTECQFKVLSRLSDDFSDPPSSAKINTLLSLCKMGFAQYTFRGDRERLWRRTERGANEITHLMGGKD